MDTCVTVCACIAICVGDYDKGQLSNFCFQRMCDLARTVIAKKDVQQISEIYKQEKSYHIFMIGGSCC